MKFFLSVFFIVCCPLFSLEAGEIAWHGFVFLSADDEPQSVIVSSDIIYSLAIKEGTQVELENAEELEGIVALDVRNDFGGSYYWLRYASGRRLRKDQVVKLCCPKDVIIYVENSKLY
jgi:hypothetical protein